MRNLIFATMLILCLAVLFYVIEKRPKVLKINYKVRQIFIGVCFGLAACFSTEYATIYSGAAINVRDAAPLCAGLLFGAPAGIIAGLVGGIHRMFWGTTFLETFTLEWIRTMFSVDVTGGFTRLACSLGTIFAGLISAIMRKKIFEDKRPSAFYAMIIGLTTEVLHLFLVFLFRLNYIERVFAVVKVHTFPMIIANMVAVLGATLAIYILSKGWRNRVKRKERKTNLSRSFTIWLMLCVSFGLFITSFGMAIVQQKLMQQQTQSTLNNTLADISENIEIEGGVDNFLNNNFTWHIGQHGGNIIGKVQKNEHGRKYVEVVLNGEDYNKGETFYLDTITKEHVWKGQDNFFREDLTIKGELVNVYGMYNMLDNDYIAIAYIPRSEASLYQSMTLYLLIFFEIITYSSLFITLYYLIRKYVINNLNKINASLEEITGGNLNTKVNVDSHSEFVNLSDEINKTVDTLKAYIAEAASRIDKELLFAKNIQISAMPSVFPAFPGRTEFDIYASMNTAKEVGGDFYDFYFVDKNTIAILIADVSGKGIPAAMFMMTAKTMIKNLAETGISVEEVFMKANDKLCETNEAGMFVTAWMGMIDLTTGKMTYSSAGHNPPLLKRHNGQFEYLKGKGGLVLAGMEGVPYRKNEIYLIPGDKIYLYTDGVTEANDPNAKLYGEDRLLELMNSRDYNTPKEICEAVLEDVMKFTGDADQFDDVTMLEFDLYELRTMEEITLIPNVESIPKVTEFVEKWMSRTRVNAKTIAKVNIVLDELYSNIAYYSNADWAKVKYHRDDENIYLQFTDNGSQYNPLEKEDPDITLSAEERQIGGLGVFMVKQMMDTVEYTYEDGKNILKLSKKL